MSNIFEKAARTKLRVASTKGALSVEQLWELPLTSAKGLSLDSIGQTVQRELRNMSEDSLVEANTSPAKAVLTLTLDVIKCIIEVKQAENTATRDSVARAAERAKLLELLESKKDEGLASLTESQIEARLAKLAA